MTATTRISEQTNNPDHVSGDPYFTPELIQRIEDAQQEIREVNCHQE